MAKGMDKGNVGHMNKPKLSIKEKQMKKKLKMQAKMAAAAAIPSAAPRI